MYKGILFDFDGVIADSMGDHTRAWQAAIASCGGSITPQDYLPLEGAKITEVAKTLLEKCGLPADAHSDAVMKEKERYYVANRRFRFYPGVEVLIKELSEARVPIAIVTASIQSLLNATVPQDFLKQFTAVVSGDQTKRGKPFPDPYLTGAEKLGLAPSECFVIENSPLGVASAKAAGSYCIGITSTVSADILKQADVIIPSFAELRSQPFIQEFLR